MSTLVTKLRKNITPLSSQWKIQKTLQKSLLLMIQSKASGWRAAISRVISQNSWTQSSLLSQSYWKRYKAWSQIWRGQQNGLNKDSSTLTPSYQSLNTRMKVRCLQLLGRKLPHPKFVVKTRRAKTKDLMFLSSVNIQNRLRVLPGFSPRSKSDLFFKKLSRTIQLLIRTLSILLHHHHLFLKAAVGFKIWAWFLRLMTLQ